MAAGRRPPLDEQALFERAPPLLRRGATGHDDYRRLDERDVLSFDSGCQPTR